MSKIRVYCSGPLFCPEEIGGMQVIAQAVEAAGMETFLPHRDGLEPYVLRYGNLPIPAFAAGIREGVDYAIFSLDVYELLERCDAVVCNLNGRVPDEGMIVEASLAFAAGKPLVLYKNDNRAPFGGFDNAMLTSLTRGKITKDINQLPSEIKAAVQREMRSGALSEYLQNAVSYGHRLSSVLSKLPDQFRQQQTSEDAMIRIIRDASA